MRLRPVFSLFFSDALAPEKCRIYRLKTGVFRMQDAGYMMIFLKPQVRHVGHGRTSNCRFFNLSSRAKVLG